MLEGWRSVANPLVGWGQGEWPDESQDGGSWVSDVYTRAGQQGIPSSQLVDPSTVNEILLEAGWNPGAAAWAAANVPVSREMRRLMPGGSASTPIQGPDPRERPAGAGAAYGGAWPGEIWGGNLTDDPRSWTADDVHALEHEAMHAWERVGNPGGSMALPEAIRWLDYQRARQSVDSQQRDVGPFGAGWRGGTSGSVPQLDAAHYNQTLFNLGYNPQDLPQWYRDRYLREYNPWDLGEDDEE